MGSKIAIWNKFKKFKLLN